MKLRFALITGLVIIATLMPEIIHAQGGSGPSGGGPGGPPPPGPTSAPLDPASWALLAGGAFVAVKKKFFSDSEKEEGTN